MYGALILVALGLLDDIYNLNPGVKLFGQIAAAFVFVNYNSSHLFIFYEFFERFNLPGEFAYILLIGWIVLMINAINLVDGMDGLAAGITAIIFIAMAAITLLNMGSAYLLAIQVIIAGSCVGFLFYNFNPARIFMGDTGSMLLGYLLAVIYILSLEGVMRGSVALGSIFIFMYPILDISFAIVRRLLNRESIFRGDKGHIHHILLSLGFSVRKTVILIYLLNIFFASLAMVLLCMNLPSSALIAIGIITAVLTVYVFRHLRMISKRNGICVPAKPMNIKRAVIEESD